MIIVKDGCTLTLKDSTSEGSIVTRGKVAQVIDDSTLIIESGKYQSVDDVAFWAGGNEQTGHIIINGGEIEAQEFAVVAGKNSSLEINGGKLIAHDNAVIGGNGTKDKYDNITINVNGGEFEGHIETGGYTGCGIYMPTSGTVNVAGGKFTIDGVGICARAGDINISGGEFISTADQGKIGRVGDSRRIISANALFYDCGANYPHLGSTDKINITGGTFVNEKDPDIVPVVVTPPTVDGKLVPSITNNTSWGVEHRES